MMCMVKSYMCMIYMYIVLLWCWCTAIYLSRSVGAEADGDVFVDLLHDSVIQTH